MQDEITHDELMDALTDAGKAIGFAVGTAFAGAFQSTDAKLLMVSRALSNLSDTERFSPNVNLVVRGFSEGLEAFTNASPDPDMEGQII